MASLAEKRIVDAEEPSVDPQARPEELRLLEALLFASTEPLDQAALAKKMPDGVDIKVALAQLETARAGHTLRLAQQLEQLTGLESRVTILGHLQRGGTPKYPTSLTR